MSTIDHDFYLACFEIQMARDKMTRLEKNLTKHLEREAQIQKQVVSSESELSNLEKKLKLEESRLLQQKEKRLEEVEAKIVTSKKVLEQPARNAGNIEQELQKLQAQKDQLEEEIFAHLEQQELLQKREKKLLQFLAGAKDSFEKIRSEVAEDVAKEKKEMAYYQNRISKFLSPELMEDKRSVVIKGLTGRFPVGKFYSAIDGVHCKTCSFAISSTKLTATNNLNSLELCSGCKRLLIPEAIDLENY